MTKNCKILQLKKIPFCLFKPKNAIYLTLGLLEGSSRRPRVSKENIQHFRIHNTVKKDLVTSTENRGESFSFSRTTVPLGSDTFRQLALPPTPCTAGKGLHAQTPLPPPIHPPLPLLSHPQVHSKNTIRVTGHNQHFTHF
jgi:hypothetical protein